MMSISHDEVMESLSPERRARIKAKAKEIFEEEVTLRDLRTNSIAFAFDPKRKAMRHSPSGSIIRNYFMLGKDEPLNVST